MSVVIVKRFVYERFPFLSYKSKVRVISVGNITAGGSGKTPVTIFLTELLKLKEFKVAVVLRGYKGAFEKSNKLISNYEKVFECAKESGDEANLYVSKLKNTPVCVGRDRKKSVIMLETLFPDLDYIIMDDAFQNFKVRQDVKVCVINTLNPFGNGFCLPAGILREPLFALRKADMIFLNGKNDISAKITASKKIPVFRGYYEVKEFWLNDDSLISIEELKNSSNILLSGIGLPKSFEKTVIEAQIPFKEHIVMSDHSEYSADYLQSLSNKIKRDSIDYIITTEKDFCKLRKYKLNFVVVHIKFKITEEDLPSLFACL